MASRLDPRIETHHCSLNALYRVHPHGIPHGVTKNIAQYCTLLLALALGITVFGSARAAAHGLRGNWLRG